MAQIRYSAAACQTDLSNPVDRHAMRANTDRMLSMIDSAVMGSAPFLPVRLVVFPEFAHSAPVFQTVDELREKLAVQIPNEHTVRLEVASNVFKGLAREEKTLESNVAVAAVQHQRIDERVDDQIVLPIR